MFGLMPQLVIFQLQQIIHNNGNNGGKIIKMFNYINLWEKIIFHVNRHKNTHISHKYDNDVCLFVSTAINASVLSLLILFFFFVCLVHCVIFPCSLLGTSPQDSYTLLHHINTTEYLNYEGLKFSKSRGTGVFGDDAKKTGIPSEVWRYYMLFNRPEQSDTVFLWEDFAAKNNTELSNNLGNFINRTLTFVKNSYQSIVPAPTVITPEDQQFLDEVSVLLSEYIDLMEQVKLKDGLKHVMNISKKANQFMQDHKPCNNTNANAYLYPSVDH